MTLEAATLFTLFADGPYFRRLPADTTALTSNDDNLTADYLAAFDVKIKVGEGNDSATFLACSDVLCSRSQYFYASLSNTVITEEDLFFILEKPHIRPDTFEDILRYICTGATNIDQLDASTLFELLKAADELLLNDLVEGIKSVFFRRYQKCQPDSPVTILNEIFQQSLTNDFEDLVRDLIEENPWALYKSPDLHYVSEATMQRLAEHANANGSQGVILDIIIKWGIRKNQQLPMSISQWKRKEFTILKRTIKRVINFLRFTDRVNGYANAALIPFEMIAPTKMVKQLRAAGALPMGPFHPCLQVPNTNLISDELADRLLEQLHGGDGAWLQPSKNVKPLFKTLFASKSKLGISSAHLPPKRTVAYRLLIRCVSKQRTFYTKFDGRGGVIRAPTLILARRENSPQVVGGYAAEGVTNPQQAVRGESKDSFIFSFPSWNIDENTGELVDDVDEPQWQDRGICRGDINLDLDGKNITVKPDYYVGKDFIGRPKELDIQFEECEMLEVHKEEIELAVGC